MCLRLMYGTRLNLWLIRLIHDTRWAEAIVGRHMELTTDRWVLTSLLYTHLGFQWLLRTMCAVHPL